MKTYLTLILLQKRCFESIMFLFTFHFSYIENLCETTKQFILYVVDYLTVIACNSGTQMRVRDSSATRIFF